MNKTKNISFLILNVVCSASAIFWALIISFSHILSIKIFNSHPLSENDSYFFFFCFIFGIIYLFIKLFSFPIIYGFGKMFPKMHYELKKSIINKKHTLLWSIKLDFIIIILTSMLISIIRTIAITESFFLVIGITILSLGGVTTSYIIFFLMHMFFKFVFKDFIKYGKIK